MYAHWRGRFYPRGLATKRWLSYLAERLSTVEVNGTFYSLTRPAACDAWRDGRARRVRVRGEGQPLHHAHAEAPRLSHAARELLRVR